MANSPQEVLVECRQHDVKAVALHLTDALGKWHQLTIPVTRLTEEAFEDGFPWCLPRLGSRSGEVTDVLLIPQPATAFIGPFAETPTLSILCSMHDPLTREELPDDPRAIAIKAEKFAKDSGVADEVLIGLGIEFFLLTRKPSDHKRHSSRPRFDQPREMGFENRFDRQPNYGELLEDDFRSQAMQALDNAGVAVASHRQPGNDRTKSRLEISESGLVSSADNLMITKHLVRQLAARWSLSATFMPLPEAGREPAAMPTQMALLLGGDCGLSGSGYAGLSESGLHAIGGILRHAPAIMALTNSTTNSYCRFGRSVSPAQGQPLIAYSQSDLQAAIRIPTLRLGKHKCLEFQLPDALCNPYLAFAALLMAAIDGVQNKIHPGPAMEPDPYEGQQSSMAEREPVPTDLSTALLALENDAEFLLRGDVVSPEFVQAWINQKRLTDIEPLRRQPHPHEVASYFEG